MTTTTTAMIRGIATLAFMLDSPPTFRKTCQPKGRGRRPRWMVTWYGKTFQPARMEDRKIEIPTFPKLLFLNHQSLSPGMGHPEPRTMLCSYHAPGAAKDLPRCSSGTRSSRPSWIALTVQQSRSFGCAETSLKCVVVRGLPRDSASRG